MKITTSQLTFTQQSEETLLEGLQRTGHFVEFQCREGYCGSCRMRIKGDFKYIRTPLAYTAPGEVLVCCAIPTTDIVLDADFLEALKTA